MTRLGIVIDEREGLRVVLASQRWGNVTLHRVSTALRESDLTLIVDGGTSKPHGPKLEHHDLKQ